jgi:CheY-like chemotaxis protein
MCGTIPAGEARVLIAEDNIMNKLLIIKLMQRFGIERFKVVENGLDVLQAHRDSKWDVILVDIHMPQLNGYEATAAIRSLEKSNDAHIPIIAMTANAMVGDREKCLRQGMDDYISKPIDMDELKDIMGQWIKMDCDTINVDHFDPVDLAQIRNIANGDQSFEKELVEAFIKQSDQNLAILQVSCGNGDNFAWTEAAHMFKGSANGVGAAKLGLLCAQAETRILFGDNEQKILLNQIEHEYRRVHEHFRKTGFLTDLPLTATNESLEIELAVVSTGEQHGNSDIQ